MQIRELDLVTPVLIQQHDFDTGVSGLPAFDRAPRKVSLQGGSSRLTLAQAADPHPRCYHLACNIPENEYVDAKARLRQRVALPADAAGEGELLFQGPGCPHAVPF
jgi:hypothetical protein